MTSNQLFSRIILGYGGAEEENCRGMQLYVVLKERDHFEVPKFLGSGPFSLVAGLNYSKKFKISLSSKIAGDITFLDLSCSTIWSQIWTNNDPVPEEYVCRTEKYVNRKLTNILGGNILNGCIHYVKSFYKILSHKCFSCDCMIFWLNFCFYMSRYQIF